jgi:2,2-dialkylglycine decarboxylase (pyruvate)
MGGELERSAKENLIRYGGDTFSEIVASAKGCHITTVSGRKILDFTSGQMCATIGHNHPAIVSAIQQSAETAAHSDTSDQVFRRHMISHSGVSDHPEMTPSGAVW